MTSRQGGMSWDKVREFFLQAANTHSNTHMHLNTFLPFVYAVSMVRVVLIKLNDNLSSQIGYAYGLMFLVIERYLFVIFPKRHEWWDNFIESKRCRFSTTKFDFKVTWGSHPFEECPAIHGGPKGLLWLSSFSCWGFSTLPLEDGMAEFYNLEIRVFDILIIPKVILVVFILALSGGSSLYNLVMYEVSQSFPNFHIIIHFYKFPNHKLLNFPPWLSSFLAWHSYSFLYQRISKIFLYQ